MENLIFIPLFIVLSLAVYSSKLLSFRDMTSVENAIKFLSLKYITKKVEFPFSSMTERIIILI